MTPRARLNKYITGARKVECRCGRTFTTPFMSPPVGYNKYLRHYLDKFFAEGPEVANRKHHVEAYDQRNIHSEGGARQKASPLEKEVIRMMRKGMTPQQIIDVLTRR